MPHKFYGPDGQVVTVDHPELMPEGFADTPKAFYPEGHPEKQSYYDSLPVPPKAAEPEPQDDEDDDDPSDELTDAEKAILEHPQATILAALKARGVPIGRDRSKARLARLLARAEAEDAAHEESLNEEPTLPWSTPTDDVGQ